MSGDLKCILTYEKKRWGKGGRHLASFGKKKRKEDFGCSSYASRQVLNSDFDRTTTGCFKGAVGIYFVDDVVFYRRGRIGRITRRGGGALLRVVMMMREWARDEVIR